MKVGETDFTLEAKGQCESYSLSKLISAASSFGCWPISNFGMKAVQVWERVSPACNRPGLASVSTNTGFPGCPKTIDPPVSPSIRPANAHLIVRFFKSKNRFELVTLNGTATGSPPGGLPGLSAGSAGPKCSHSPYTATTTVTMGESRTASHHQGDFDFASG